MHNRSVQADNQSEQQAAGQELQAALSELILEYSQAAEAY